MNYLHNNQQLFSDILNECSNDTGIARPIIEKDYYVTLLLKNIVNNCPNVIFKGGTSLSKCHKIINRFSEDLDLGLNIDKATQGMRRDLKKQIIKAINDLHLVLDNESNIYSRTYFNRYQIQYPLSEEILSLKPYLYVETALFLKPFPYEIKQADSYIYRFLIKRNQTNLIDLYQLHPFDVKVQSIDRTFIDKLFALGDYYLKNKLIGYSRHLYDLYKLSDEIIYNEDFFKLFNEVKLIRAEDEECLSAQSDQNLKLLLTEICNKDYFKKDYENTTEELLFEKIDYNTTKDNLLKIIDNLND